MVQPRTIIYSDGLYADLLQETGHAAGRIKKGGLSLRRLEESIHTGPLRRISDGAEIASRRETVTKVRVGMLADVAPMADAYGSDMAEYGTIIFDLAFELEIPAIRRIVELNMEVTGDGDYRTPHTWSSIAAKPHVVLLILSRTKELPTGSPNGQPQVRISSSSEIKFVRTNYDLVDRLPYKFRPFDSKGELGRALGPNNYALDEGLAKRAAGSFNSWMKHGTAFRHLDEDNAPTAIRQQPFGQLSSGANSFTVAGAYQLEKSLIGFVPQTDLTPIKWIKAATDIGDFLDQCRRSASWLSKMSESDSVLRKLRLIVRKSTIKVSLEIDGHEFEMKVQARTGRGTSDFNRNHLRVMELIQSEGNKTIKQMAELMDYAKSATVSSLMSDLRAGSGAALKAAHHPEELADKIFPPRLAAISKNIPRENIVIGD